MTPQRARWFAATLTLLLLLVPFSRGLEKPGAPMEEGALLVQPERVLHGAVPYRDFESFCGPADPYLLAGAFVVFGASVTTERCVGLAWRVLALGALFVLLQRRGLTLATSGVMLAAIVLLPAGAAAYAWMGALACALWSLWLSTEGSHPSRCLLGGLLAGLAMLFRADLTLVVAMAGLPLWLAMPAQNRTRFLLGGGLALLPPALLALVAGPSALLDNLLISPLRSAPAGYLPLSALPPSGARLLWLLLAANILNLTARVTAFRAGDRTADARLLMALALLGLGGTYEALRQADLLHLAMAAFVPLAVAPAALAELMRREYNQAPGLLAAGIALTLIAGGTSAMAPQLFRYAGTETWRQLAAKPMEVTNFQSGDRSFPVSSVAVAISAGPIVDDLQHFGKAGQRLFVGPGDLRRTNASDTFIYHLLPQFVPATYFLEMNPLSANRPGSRLATDIASADWLVLNRAWDDWDEPNASRQYGSDEANEVVRTQFERCARHGTFRALPAQGAPSGDVKRAELFQHFVPQLVAVHGAVVAPDDFAAGADEHSVREAARPFRIERRHERAHVRAGEKVAVGRAAFGFERRLEAVEQPGALLLEKGFRLGRVLRLVGADGDQLKVAHAELARGGDQLRKLARRTARRWSTTR